jgi:glycosyltransferase involved in cell wall biosynthesis
MLLGVPSVASYVGGTPDLLEHQLEGYLYQHDAPYMMAHFVKEIFSNDELAQKFSKNARSKALHRHDVDKNTKRLLAIYKEIIEGAK